MSKVIYKDDNIELRSWDIVKLSNGMIVSIFGAVYENVMNTELPFDENTPIYISTTPISSMTSYCYPEHIIEIVEHCGCFENQINSSYKQQKNQPLHIRLEKGKKE